ncbi:Fic family protein [Methylomagnum sp.]
MNPLFPDLDRDLRAAFLAQLRNLWTHTSTALEGNTLTLGETAFVIEEGLTVSGKPLKHHQEVVGHARAVDLVYEWLDRPDPITDSDLLALHRAVQTEIVIDLYCPVGAWKRESNGTHAATPADTPGLMAVWLDGLNAALAAARSGDSDGALAAYVRLHVGFVRIHPFSGGNGRLARLLANLPVLKAVLPLIVIDHTRRREYLDLLHTYDLGAGSARAGVDLLPEPGRLAGFTEFCRECWRASTELVAEAYRRQAARVT